MKQNKFSIFNLRVPSLSKDGFSNTQKQDPLPLSNFQFFNFPVNFRLETNPKSKIQNRKFFLFLACSTSSSDWLFKTK